ncbi:MAG: carbon-nitrogen hydrolase family protein [Pirellulaceae bacterium]|nr:carbon-nitrogen hydrolase family protein [Pirellulaceae bacterium]
MAAPTLIAAAQIDIAFADGAKNLARMIEVVEATAKRGARLTIFPEAALAGYCFDSLDEARPHAEPIPGPSTAALLEVCRRHDTHVIYGLLEAYGPRIYNATVLVGPSGVVGSYRKIHLPFLGVDRFTTPGDRPFAVQEAAGVRVGMNICYDGGFPESSRVLTLLGADLIVLPTNWPPGAQCMASCAVNARAMENNVYYAAVDRVGDERGFHFIGHSKICDPSGRVLAEAPHDREEILYAEIDVALARQKKIVRRANLHEIDRIRDRRPDFYLPITALPEEEA